MMATDRLVYVVDDDDDARESVRALVRSMGVSSEAFGSAEDFLDSFDPAKPGCLVTDVRMLGMSGIELQERLLADDIQIPVIIITAHPETPMTVKAVKKGAVSVLEKPCRDYELYEAIRDALDRDARLRAEYGEKKKFAEKLGSLTSVERDVLDLIVVGETNKVIARRLDVSVRTVENRRQRIFEKTDSGSLAELIRLFVKTTENVQQ